MVGTKSILTGHATVIQVCGLYNQCNNVFAYDFISLRIIVIKLATGLLSKQYLLFCANTRCDKINRFI